MKDIRPSGLIKRNFEFQSKYLKNCQTKVYSQ